MAYCCIHWSIGGWIVGGMRLLLGCGWLVMWVSSSCWYAILCCCMMCGFGGYFRLVEGEISTGSGHISHHLICFLGITQSCITQLCDHGLVVGRMLIGFV